MEGISPYAGIIGLFLVASGFVATMLVISSLVGPKNANVTKQLPFECGSVSVGDVHQQRFNVRFYLIAMLFILFDIEVIFMYPWAAALGDLGWFGFWNMMIFIVVLTVALVYVWKKGILNWNTAE